MRDVIKSNLNIYKYRDSNGNILCEIIVIYRSSDTDKSKYRIEVELREYVDTPYQAHQEFRWPVSTQEITSRDVTISYDVDRLVNRMIETRFLDRYIKELDNGIALTIEWMKEIA